MTPHAIRTSAVYHNGVASAELHTDGASELAGLTSVPFLAPRTRKVPVSLWAKSDGTPANLGWAIDSYDSSDVLIDSFGASPAVGTSWARLTDVAALPPATTPIAYLKFRIYLTGHASSRTIWVDTISVGPQIANDDLEDDSVDGGKLAPTIDLESNILVGTATGGVITLRGGAGNRVDFEDENGVNFGGLGAGGDTTANSAEARLQTNNGKIVLNALEGIQMLGQGNGINIDDYLDVQDHIQANGSVIVGTGLATTATDGFLYIPSCAGAPTGTPTLPTGTVPLVWDSVGERLYLYTSGAWLAIA